MATQESDHVKMPPRNSHDRVWESIQKLTISLCMRDEIAYWAYIWKNATNRARHLRTLNHYTAFYRKWKKWLRDTGWLAFAKFDGLGAALPYRTPPPSALDGSLLDTRGVASLSKTQTNAPTTDENPLQTKAEHILLTSAYNDQKALNTVKKLFDTYLSKIDNKYIVLRHKTKYLVKLIEYETRFNSKDRAIAQAIKYDTAWKKATKRFKTGVFLTLTTDPSNFESVGLANQNISHAFNSFMSWVRKRLKFRPPYIRVLEFTQSGLAHLHIVLFGISRIADISEISAEWERLGQGKIVYAYKLLNRGGRWIWAKARPRNTHQQIKNYLRKYLFKAKSNNGYNHLYWALNLRFATYSRVLIFLRFRRDKQDSEWEMWKIIPLSLIFDEIPYFYKIENWT